MKILKYILVIVILLTLYITEPLWRVYKTTEVSQIDEKITKQQKARNKLKAEEAEKLRILEEKFGKKPSTAYKSRVPAPLQTYWDKSLNTGESIYEDICTPLQASEKGWVTTCQYKIRGKKSSSGLQLETYIIKDGKVIR